jgi:hypothetical protein
MNTIYFKFFKSENYTLCFVYLFLYPSSVIKRVRMIHTVLFLLFLVLLAFFLFFLDLLTLLVLAVARVGCLATSNLFICRHLYNSSVLWFSGFSAVENRIRDFSAKQRLHLKPSKADASSRMRQSVRCFIPLSFNL